MLLVAMFFAKEGYVELAFVCLVASLWAIIWNYCGYLLGIKHWDKFFKKYGLWFGIWMTEVKYLKQWIQKWWPIWVTLWKFHNVARAFVPFIAGSMGMNRPNFMLFNIIGSIIRASTMIILWTIFGKYYEWIINHIWIIMLIILLWVVLYLYFFKREWLKQYIKEKNDELDEMVEKK
jgi:membrane protein DedA with SNARE-associated domain